MLGMGFTDEHIYVQNIFMFPLTINLYDSVHKVSLMYI